MLEGRDNSGEDEFLGFAAAILAVQRERLSMETACGDVPEWDSVMHLRLVMETEARYGVRIPLEAMAELKSLGSLYRLVAAGSRLA